MSIKRKVTILFFISLILMITLTIWIDRVNNRKNQKLIVQSYVTKAKEILPLIVDNNYNLLSKKLEELSLKRVKNIENNYQNIFKKEFTFGEIDILKSKDNYLLLLKYLDEEYIFRDDMSAIFFQEEIVTNSLLILDIIILLFIYIAILKLISPIKELSTKLYKFSKGDYDIRMQERGGREIEVASKSFNIMATALKNGIEERENLLKYIGHELRTPLAKAKFALLKDDKKILDNSLKEIEKLINEILNMHLLDSKRINREKFNIETLLSLVFSKIYIEDENLIEIEYDDFDIYADKEYLSVALKNLVDNALKYSTKYPIKIVAKENKIEVISFGDKLKRDFQYYLLPFTRENQKDGYGLGLNIVNRILQKHNFTLSYTHTKRVNIFKIKLSNR